MSEISDYDDLLLPLGEQLVTTQQSDYQGDSLYLIRNSAGELGFLTFGWGSCSGCDALGAALSPKDDEKLKELFDDLAAGVVWKATPKEMPVYLQAKDWKATFLCEELVEEFLLQAVPLLEAHA